MLFPTAGEEEVEKWGLPRNSTDFNIQNIKGRKDGEHKILHSIRTGIFEDIRTDMTSFCLFSAMKQTQLKNCSRDRKGMNRSYISIMTKISSKIKIHKLVIQSIRTYLMVCLCLSFQHDYHWSEWYSKEKTAIMIEIGFWNKILPNFSSEKVMNKVVM